MTRTAICSPHYNCEIFRLALPALGALAAELALTSSPTRRSSVTSAARRSCPALRACGDGARGGLHDLQLPHVRARRQSSRAPPAPGEHEEPPGWRRRRSGPRSGSARYCSSAARSSPGPLLRALGATAGRATTPRRTFRIAAIGLPAALVALAGQGYLRGVSNLRRPLEIVVVANIANAVLEVLSCTASTGASPAPRRERRSRRPGWGWRSSSSCCAPRRLEAAEPAGDAADDPRRPADLRADGRAVCVLPRCGVGLARMGDRRLGGASDRVAALPLLALVLDSVAIAGQVIVGRMLGAGDADSAYASAVRNDRVVGRGRRGVRRRARCRSRTSCRASSRATAVLHQAAAALAVLCVDAAARAAPSSRSTGS